MRAVLNPVDGPWAGAGAPDLAAYGVNLATVPPHQASTALSLTSQVLYAVKVVPMERIPVTMIGTRVNTAGASPTAGYNGFAIYQDGTTLAPLGASADDTTLWTTAGWRARALTSALVLLPGVPVWLAMVSRCTTAPSVFQSAPGNAALLSSMPGGKTVGSLAAQTGLSTPLTKASLVDLASRPFIAVY